MGLQPAPDRGGDPDEEEEEELQEPETAGEERPAPAAEPLKHVSAGQNLQGLHGRLTVGFEQVQTRSDRPTGWTQEGSFKIKQPPGYMFVCVGGGGG